MLRLSSISIEENSIIEINKIAEVAAWDIYGLRYHLYHIIIDGVTDYISEESPIELLWTPQDDSRIEEINKVKEQILKFIFQIVRH